MTHCPYGVSRRSFLHGAAAMTAWSMAPRIASAAGAPDPRLLVVILRGALDGLATVVPTGDPGWDRLRDDVRLPPDGAQGGAAGLPLDGFFVLNPALPRLYELYRREQAAFVHAVATPYRRRSHFDGQQVLESGLPGVARQPTGWLNRMLGEIAAGRMVEMARASAKGLAVGPVVPLIMQGSAPVTAWSNMADDYISPDTLERLLALYDRTDHAMHHALAQAIETQRLSKTLRSTMTGSTDSDLSGIARRYIRVAEGTGRLLADPVGPRVATVSFDGWDTHTNEGPVQGRLGRMLGALDAAIYALARTMAPVWNETTILVVTEFGRTAYENGNDGTDHGTGSAAMLIGGAVAGGRVIADWPGLSEQQLLANRDLAATTDMRSIIKGIAGDAFEVSRAALDEKVLPGSAAAPALEGLLRG